MTLEVTWANRSSTHSVTWDGCLTASLGQVCAGLLVTFCLGSLFWASQ